MKTIRYNEPIELSFIAHDTMRQIMRNKIEELGVPYQANKLNINSTEFTITFHAFNRIAIGQLNDLFNSR